MTYRHIGREPTPDEEWDPRGLRPSPEERRNFLGIRFVRLASLSHMGMLLSMAYETRLQPDAADSPKQLFVQLRSLPPEDLGRFLALENANAAQYIVSRTLSGSEKPPRLTVLGRPGMMGRAAPAMECCDAHGQPLTILRPGTAPYKKALSFSRVVDQLIEAALSIPSTETKRRSDVFRSAWAEAGHELLAAAGMSQEEIEASGPDLANLTKTVTLNESPFYEQFFYGEQPPQTP